MEILLKKEIKFNRDKKLQNFCLKKTLEFRFQIARKINVLLYLT